MSVASEVRGTGLRTPRRAPWHLWLVGGLALIWHLAGTITIQMAQLGRLQNLSDEEGAYYASKPIVLVAVTAVATYGSLIASGLLLLRRKASVPLFDATLACVMLLNSAEMLIGGSRAFAEKGAGVATGIIVLTAVAMPIYARSLRNRDILR